MADNIYSAEQNNTSDEAKKEAEFQKWMLNAYNSNDGNISDADFAAHRNSILSTYDTGKDTDMYQGGGLYNTESALFGGSGAAAQTAQQDIDTSTRNAMSANDIEGNANVARQGQSSAYGTTQTNAANATLGNAANELNGLGNTGAANALAIRGVAGAGTEGTDLQGKEAAALGSFDPTSSTASQTLHQQTQNNAAALQSLALSGRGSGVNASAQSRGNALSGAALAGESLQQQQLAASEYQTNQALQLQALQGQSTLAASQQTGATANANFAQQQQTAAANATLAGQQNQYTDAASANQLQLQQAENNTELAKQQQALASTQASSQQTLGQVSANELGQAQDLHQQQLTTEAKQRTQGLVNAAQTSAGLQNSALQLSTQNNIQNQAADTAMLGSMMTTGAGAVSSATKKDDK